MFGGLEITVMVLGGLCAIASVLAARRYITEQTRKERKQEKSGGGNPRHAH